MRSKTSALGVKKILIVLLFLAVVAFGAYGNYKSGINSSVGETEELVTFEINPGEGVKKIGANLIAEDLIESDFFFETYIWRTENETKLQAGIYELNKGLSIIEIVDKLIAGEILSQEENIKILEGWKIIDMEEYFVKNNILGESDFSKQVSAPVSDWSFTFAKPSYLEDVPFGVDLEGYIFPDTYRIFVGASAEDIIEKTLDNFDNKLDQELRDEIKSQGKSIHEIITLASIIEKEVASEDDMAIVSGLLYKRMEIGMRLEVDASVNYASGKSDPSVTYADLQIDSPYNTYKYDGLPPGPICSPGLQAIKAAIYPKESPYLFYLNRQDTGETIFSKNFDEHIRNKNKYLK